MSLVTAFLPTLLVFGSFYLVYYLFSNFRSRTVWDYQIFFKDKQSVPDLGHPELLNAFKVRSRSDNMVIVESRVSDGQIKRLISETYGLTPADFSVVSARKYFNFF